VRALVIAAVLLAAPATADAQISKLIYMNRCDGGCDVNASGNDNSLNDESRIPTLNGISGTSTLSAWRWGDPEWEALVQCVADVYAPYDVEIVTEDPAPAFHHEIMVAGYGTELGYTPSQSPGGVAAGGAGCNPADNALSFVFANQGGSLAYLCGAVAQESGHSFGLPDHILDCTDPMTYLDLGGSSCPRKFFRNKLMPCGEFSEVSCRCGGSRINPHIQLLSVFGKGQDPDPPVATITYPAVDASITENTVVVVQASDERGIKHIELLINGWPWGAYDQPESITPPYQWPSAYTVDLDSGFPDGIIELEAIVSNDLDVSTTVTRTVRKGSPCASADSCLDGQRCDEGRCLWDAPEGQLGQECTFDQFCEGPNTYDGVCATNDAVTMCTYACFAGPNDSCPDGYACRADNGVSGAGVCWVPPPSESCTDCSGGRGGSTPILMGLAVGFLVLRRRRR